MDQNLFVNAYVVAPVFIYVFYVFWTRWKKPTDALNVLPWVGLPKGRLARLRARYTMASGKEAIRQAFQQYNQKGLSFVYQTFMGEPFIVLPVSYAQWIIEQPDDVLSFKDATVDQLSLDETSLSPQISRDPIHHDVIKGNLTRSLASTSPLVLDELQKSFSSVWGDDEAHWTTQNVWHSMTNIFAQTSGRIFVGLPLCRNDDFLSNVVKYAELVVSTGVKIRGLPATLKPILAQFLLRPNKHHFSEIYTVLAPVIEERKGVLSQVDGGEDKEEPFDLLQWLIHRAYQTGQSIETATAMICKRFAVVCFAAIHTTSLTSTNLILDILAADPRYDTIACLRDEMLKVQLQCNGKWDKSSLAKLVRLDSTIRESQRMHSAGSWALHRKVKARGGVVMPDGLLAPKGAHIAVSSYNIQRDTESYEDPETFDPFRFSRPREDLLQAGNQSADGALDSSTRDRASQILKDRNYAAVSTGLTHLPFGHGRHACPGRFFAIQEVKLMLVHVILNYELQPLEERPPNPWLGDVMTPNTTATISVRKMKRNEASGS